jgi:hypothetical protein
MVPLSFQGLNDAYDVSLFLWRHVNREKRCNLCRKPFEYNEHFQHVFSVALDAENNLAFLHRSCAANSQSFRVFIEGSNYSDIIHELSVSWRGNPDRAVVGETAELGHEGTLLQLLHAQERAQLTAEVRALGAELERRRALRAAGIQ